MIRLALFRWHQVAFASLVGHIGVHGNIGTFIDERVIPRV